jgi:hypothetical protein
MITHSRIVIPEHRSGDVVDTALGLNKLAK